MNISKKTLVFLAAICGLLLFNKFYQIYEAFFVIPKEYAGIGIIGGVDGPTVVFLITQLLPRLLFPVLCLFLEIFLYLYVLIKSIMALVRKV